MQVDNMVRLTTGGVAVDIRGEMLHAQCVILMPSAASRPAGGVAALVTKLTRGGVDLELVARTCAIAAA